MGVECSVCRPERSYESHELAMQEELDPGTPEGEEPQVVGQEPVCEIASKSDDVNVATSSLSDADVQLVRGLLVSNNPVKQWFVKSVKVWSELPLGEECKGVQLFQAVESLADIYPYVFCRSFASEHLAKDLGSHVRGARRHWPEGAVNVREAIQGEVARIGVDEIEKRYFNTGTVRLIFIWRTMHLVVTILDSLANNKESPVQSAQHAVNKVLGPVLNGGLRKIVNFILWFCVYTSRDKMLGNMGIQEKEAITFLPLLVKVMHPHHLWLEALFREEVPSVVAKKP